MNEEQAKEMTATLDRLVETTAETLAAELDGVGGMMTREEFVRRLKQKLHAVVVITMLEMVSMALEANV